MYLKKFYKDLNKPGAKICLYISFFDKKYIHIYIIEYSNIGGVKTPYIEYVGR